MKHRNDGSNCLNSLVRWHSGSWWWRKSRCESAGESEIKHELKCTKWGRGRSTERSRDRYSFQDCVGRQDNDGDYDDNALEWFWLPFVDVCVQRKKSSWCPLERRMPCLGVTLSSLHHISSPKMQKDTPGSCRWPIQNFSTEQSPELRYDKHSGLISSPESFFCPCLSICHFLVKKIMMRI